ncbi:hypothetical protein PACTADRAFT_32385 [Pachysolen tannophilus NRRL Y-2460]|uniref:Autophagy-related protein 16 domain-containing protein n=1 Tax=Pachysolen tannophilus NRRL Y-2460 TaxID=669874 RepID=A0A1E4TYR2_PACTA|nr:hypothetical protein PACTADRAFT_32385 [Pachysolen tannophilus NRRL Y-2460]
MVASWQRQLSIALEERDLTEKANIDYYKACLLNHLVELSAIKVYRLENELENIQKTDIQKELTNALREINTLKLENENLKRNQSREELKLREARKNAAELEKHLDTLRDAYRKLEKNYRNLKEESDTKFKNLDVINDEILSLQIENNLLNKENSDLKLENDKMVQRWLKKVEKDANFLNQVVEKADNK